MAGLDLTYSERFVNWMDSTTGTAAQAASAGAVNNAAATASQATVGPAAPVTIATPQAPVAVAGRQLLGPPVSPSAVPVVPATPGAPQSWREALTQRLADSGVPTNMAVPSLANIQSAYASQATDALNNIAGAGGAAVSNVLQNPLVANIVPPDALNSLRNTAASAAAGDFMNGINVNSAFASNEQPALSQNTPVSSLAPSGAWNLIMQNANTVPYGDLDSLAKRGLDIAALKTTAASMQEVVMHYQRSSKKAVIKIVDFNTNDIYTFPYFMLHNFDLGVEERFHMYEAFDSSFLYLFGDKPITAQFVLSMYDMQNAQWFRSFFNLYKTHMAGYQAATKKYITYILVDDLLIEGIIVKMNPTKTSESNEIVRMSMFMFVTGLTILDDPVQINRFGFDKTPGKQTPQQAEQATQAAQVQFLREAKTKLQSTVAAAAGQAAASAQDLANGLGVPIGLQKMMADSSVGKAIQDNMSSFMSAFSPATGAAAASPVTSTNVAAASVATASNAAAVTGTPLTPEIAHAAQTSANADGVTSSRMLTQVMLNNQSAPIGGREPYTIVGAPAPTINPNI